MFYTQYKDSNERMYCDWTALRTQLLMQWQRLSAKELDQVGPDRNRLSILVQRKYGIAAELVKHYLANLERILPAEGHIALAA